MTVVNSVTCLVVGGKRQQRPWKCQTLSSRNFKNCLGENWSQKTTNMSGSNNCCYARITSSNIFYIPLAVRLYIICTGVQGSLGIHLVGGRRGDEIELVLSQGGHNFHT